MNILWPIYIKSQVDSEMLALIQATLDFKTKRSHFIRRICCNADEVSLFISDPEKFGQNMMANLDEAGLTDLAPVPNIFAELKFCSCQRIVSQCVANVKRTILRVQKYIPVPIAKKTMKIWTIRN